MMYPYVIWQGDRNPIDKLGIYYSGRSFVVYQNKYFKKGKINGRYIRLHTVFLLSKHP